MAHWRDSARDVRLWMVDYRACFPLLFFMLNISWTTFYIAFGTMFFFGVLQHWGFSVPVFARWFRSFLAGPRKIAQPWWKS